MGQPGEMLTLAVTIIPETTSMVVDLYVGRQGRDQRLWFLQADGSLSPEGRPLVSGWPATPSRELGRSSEASRKPSFPSPLRR
jgi:hypothetical protein